jgi:hypothetical protein
VSATGWSPIQPVRRGGPHLPWDDWGTSRRKRFFRTVGLGLVAFVLLLVVAVKCGGDDRAGVGSRDQGSPTSTTRPASTAPSQVVTAAHHSSDLPGATYQGPAAAVGQTVVMMGGINDTTQSTKRIWQFDPASGETRNIAVLAANTNGGASAAVGQQDYLYGGGAGNQVFDTIDSVTVGENRERVAGKLPSPRTDAVAVVDPASGTVYLVGGTGSGGQPQLDVLASTDGVTFEPVTTLAEPVRSAAVAFHDGGIWVFGGRWDDTSRTSIQRVDLTARATTVVAQLPEALSNAMAFTLADQVYVAGGRTAAGRSNAVRRFDPTTFTLSDAATLPEPLSDAAVTVVDGTAYLLGGLAGDGGVPSAKIVTVGVS